MSGVIVARTEEVDAHVLASARELMYRTFDDMAEDDWQHALHGTHAFVLDEGQVTAHASLVARTFLHGGRPLRVGYVEAVAVRSDLRRRGLGSRVMAPLEALIGGAGFDLGALGTTDEGAAFYAARGWQPWRGPLGCVTDDGIVETPEERGAVLVLAAGAELDLDGELLCDWRPGDVW